MIHANQWIPMRTNGVSAHGKHTGLGALESAHWVEKKGLKDGGAGGNRTLPSTSLETPGEARKRLLRSINSARGPGKGESAASAKSIINMYIYNSCLSLDTTACKQRETLDIHFVFSRGQRYSPSRETPGCERNPFHFTQGALSK